ncbi:hypothetical protein DYB31_008839 [Aphanomyces astaci]|uniref:Hemerythrin-like domain-containing protein n=1 Tax=Aphanomyces astaci TaxID=112090 RepID=A0A397FSA8_APHAT|nr:hypothetical protein DYB31_008839 [Aphanomyces astaci]
MVCARPGRNAVAALVGQRYQDFFLVAPIVSAEVAALALAMGATKTSCATHPRNHVITPAGRFTVPTRTGWGVTGGAQQLHPKSRSEVDILQRDHRKLIELESRVASGDYDALVEFVERLMDHLNREEMLSVLWLLEDTGALQAKLGLLSSPMRDNHIHL